MSSFFDQLTDRKSVDFADKIGDVFKSLPNLPDGLVEFFVKITPYLALLGALFNVIITPLGALATIFSLLTLSPMTGLFMLLSTVLMLVNGVLLFVAFKPLKNREHRGWMFLFWSNVFSAASTVFSILGGSSWVGGLLGLAIGFYILFQMRRFYSSATIAE